MRHLAPLCLTLGLAVTACGGDSKNLPDAPPGTPDAMGAPDAVPNTATVRVSQEDYDPSPGEPIEGAKVEVVPSAGGAIDYVTDATGTVTFPVEAGTRVWVARDPILLPAVAAPHRVRPGGVGPGSGFLYLIESVGPGDQIDLGATPSTAASTDGTLTVRYTPFAGAAGGYHDGWIYAGNTLCMDGGTETAPGTIVFATYAGCAGTQREIVLTATDVNGQSIAWLRIPNVGPIPGVLDATAATWDTTGTAYVVNYPGLDTANVYYAYTTFGSPGSWHTVYANGPTTNPITIIDGLLPTPAIAVTELLHNTMSPQFVAAPLPTIPASLDVDGANLLPFVSSPAFDPATRTISWTATSGVVAPKLVTAAFQYYDSVDLTTYAWTIYAPGSTASLVIPDVPDTVTTHDLQPGDFVYPDLWLLDVAGSSYADLLGDLDLYRADPAASGYRPTTRNLLSGGYGGAKVRTR